MIFLFVVDTGASMNQMASHGMTLLDCVKASIEYFIKLRGNRGDSFYLVDCSEGINAVKSWKSSISNFLDEVKNLQAVHISNLGPSLKTAFDLLNLYRIQKSLDTYGMGRYTWITEPAVVVMLSNGKLNSSEGIVKSLTLPLQPHQPGSELTKEPFRWDQKLISITLRFPAYTQTATTKQYTTIASNPNPNENNSPIHPASDSDEPTALMCKVTGGQCYQVRSMKELLHCMEQVISNFQQPGVVVNFEKVTNARLGNMMSDADLGVEDSDIQSIPQIATHITIYRTNQAGFWPIPESYVIDSNQPKLQSRSAQPLICFRPIQFEGFIQKGFPCDKYTIERCELTDWMIKHKAGSCWPVFVRNSSPTGKNEPFGYLKISPNNVCLFVLPFNFPRLWMLLDDLLNMKKIPTSKWKHDFETYINSIPFYYIQPLSKALKRYGVSTNAIPDHLDGNLPYPIVSKLKNLKQASKKESNRWRAILSSESDESNSVTSQQNQFGKRDRSNISKSATPNRSDSNTPDKNQTNKNIFEIPREDLLNRIQRMRAHVFSKDNSTSIEAKHNVPIAQMGNYQDVMMKREILRDINELDESKKRPIFGNPYRNEKTPPRLSANNIVDEAESATGGEQARDTPKQKSPPKLKKENTNPLIEGLFSDSSDSPKESTSKPNNTEEENLIQQDKNKPDSDVQMLEEDNLKGMDRFYAKKRIRDDNIDTQNSVFNLFKGRRNKEDATTLLKRISRLRGNKVTKQKVLDILLEKAKIYKKSELISLIEKYIEDLV